MKTTALHRIWSAALAAALSLASLNALAADDRKPAVDPKISAPAAAAAKPMAAADRMDINSASAATLATLPGIGEARAADGHVLPCPVGAFFPEP